MSQAEPQMQQDLRATVVGRTQPLPSWHPAFLHTMPEPRARFDRSPFSNLMSTVYLTAARPSSVNLLLTQPDDCAHTAMTPSIPPEMDSIIVLQIFSLPSPSSMGEYTSLPHWCWPSLVFPLATGTYVEVARCQLQAEALRALLYLFPLPWEYGGSDKRCPFILHPRMRRCVVQIWTYWQSGTDSTSHPWNQQAAWMRNT